MDGLYSPEVDVPYFTTPEKCMVAAVLERAVRDLTPIHQSQVRKRACKWILAKRILEKTTRFTFLQCADILDLTEYQIRLLQEKAEKTLQDEENKSTTWKIREEEGETTRMGVGDIFERQRNYISKKNKPVLWQNGNLRRCG